MHSRITLLIWLENPELEENSLEDSIMTNTKSLQHDLLLIWLNIFRFLLMTKNNNFTVQLH